VHRETGDKETKNALNILKDMAEFAPKQIELVSKTKGLKTQVNGFSPITSRNLWKSMMGIRSVAIEATEDGRTCTLEEHGSNDYVELSFGESRSRCGTQSNTPETMALALAAVMERRILGMTDQLNRRYIKVSKQRVSKRTVGLGRYASVPRKGNVTSEEAKDGSEVEYVSATRIIAPNSREAREVKPTTGHPMYA
jgi:hypothetical protein